MTFTLWQFNLCAWYVLLIAWGIAALNHKPDKAIEPLAPVCFTESVSLADLPCCFRTGYPSVRCESALCLAPTGLSWPA